MLQVPNMPYQVQPNFMPMQPADYNAVKIDIHNPSVGGMMPPMTPQYNPQYAPVTAPIYNYPQAPVYTYPQAQPAPQVQQPAPQAQPVACPPCPTYAPVQPAVAPVSVAPQVEEPKPVQEKAPAEAPQTVNVEEPVEKAAPQIDLNAFLARLSNSDFEIQANAMEEVANMVKEDPQKATELLDAKVVDQLVNIMNADSSKLEGPSKEQIAAREKMMSGQQISDEEKALATTITPMEQAERNKSYAMFTSAILEKLYADEVDKLTGTKVPLTELPAAMTIVDHLKDNPNPMVRTSAIEALSYIQAPEYKKDLETVFSVAKNDQDKSVQEAANAALEKLSKI